MLAKAPKREGDAGNDVTSICISAEISGAGGGATGIRFVRVQCGNRGV